MMVMLTRYLICIMSNMYTHPKKYTNTNITIVDVSFFYPT